MQTPLTDAFVKNIEKPGRYTDSATKGLNLNVKDGRKYWVLRYVLGGPRKDLSLGSYPAISLKEARNRATTCRAKIIAGHKPNAYWKSRVACVVENSGPTFRDFANECITNKAHEWRNEKHAAQWRTTIDKYANPIIGQKHLDQIDTDDILAVLTPIWYTKTETAARVRGRIEWVLAAATTRKLRSGQNPAAWRGHLETILPKRTKVAPVVHHAALPYDQVPSFMEQLRNLDATSALALQYLILNASRVGEVIGALKTEIDPNGIWTIPANRMKAGRPHRVPLGKKSLELLEVAKSLDPSSPYLFSINKRPLSNMALTMLLRRLDCKVTVHGFRSSFRDWAAEETAHSSDAAELALAHVVKNKVEAAYRRGDMLEQRRRLMNDWENYCIPTEVDKVVYIRTKMVA
jgi:integrase